MTASVTSASYVVRADFIVVKDTGVSVHKVVDYCTAGSNKQSYGQENKQRDFHYEPQAFR